MSERLRALALAATPGPWGRDACRITAKELGWARVADTEFDNDSMAENAAFIAAANPKAILALLDEMADHERAYALLFKECAELRKDAERLDYLQNNARCDPKMDGNHVWWPTSFNQAQSLKGPTIRSAIDAAKGESNAD